jgi:5-methylcytosine-specific restriction endonuclease McrBC GTP-binding regulatory subunit McrB
MTDDEKIRDNIHARESAHEIAQLARLESIGMRDGCRPRFWECLRDEISKEIPPPVVSTPRQMTDAEIREFGRSTMPFGVHLGKRIDNVPIDYLDWLLGNAAEFLVKVRQYLNSPRIQAEREQ